MTAIRACQADATVNPDTGRPSACREAFNEGAPCAHEFAEIEERTDPMALILFEQACETAWTEAQIEADDRMRNRVDLGR